MKLKETALKALKTGCAVCLAAAAVFCVIRRASECFGARDAVLAAAAFTLNDGVYRIEAGTQPGENESLPETQPFTVKPAEKTKAVDLSLEKKERDKSGYYDSFAEHPGEQVLSVAEKTILPDGTSVGSGHIKNSTGLDVDFESALAAPLTFKVEKNTQAPQVLIYHTHTSEAYLDEDVDYFYESYYSRTQNNDYNVVAVGDELERVLENNGIAVLHDATVHDSTYNGSYDRSVQTVESDMAENGGIKVVLDIHRDALGTEDCKVKTVFEHNGEKAAQIMILAGCDYYGERGFDNWRNNLSFALKLEDAAESMYPGLTRPVSFGFFAYNEYVCDGSLLIEIGTDANSIDEAERSARMLGEVLTKVLLGGS